MKVSSLFGVLILVNVITIEGRPRIMLNGVYTNLDKQNKHKRNPYNVIPAIKIIKVTEKETLDFKECFQKVDESREACLRRLRNPETTAIQADFNSDSEEDQDRTFHGYNNFSHDYLDVNDLLRSGLNKYVPVKTEKVKKSYIFKVLKPSDRYTYDLSKSRRNNRKTNYDSDESDSSWSSESISWENENHAKVAKNKRFQIVEKEESDSSQSSEEVTPKPRKKKKKETPKDELMYMQSPSRLYELRRRLPNFFPKRYHWTEDDMRKLKNYWFSGPQGRFWGQYKTPYS